MWEESRGSLEKALSPRKVIDVAVKIKKTEAAEGLAQFWLLTRYKGKREIYEANSLTETAVAQFQLQQDNEHRLAELTSVFWPPEKTLPLHKKSKKHRHLQLRSEVKEYQVVSTENFEYWVGPHSAIQINVESLSPRQGIKWVRYVSQLLGYLHSKSPTSKNFLRGTQIYSKQLEEVLRNYPAEYFAELNSENMKIQAR
jgi:hypothetical protein